MKVIDSRNPVGIQSKTLSQIGIGTVFTAIDPGQGQGMGTFLRTYGGVIDLENPARTWIQNTLVFDNFEPRQAEVTLK